MTKSPHDLIQGCLDGTLTKEEHVELNQWIRASHDNAREFASWALLHDRLRNELAASTENNARVDSNQSKHMVEAARVFASRQYTRNTLVAWATTACLFLFALSFAWYNFGSSKASAAVRELDRIIETSSVLMDRTYRITVEDVVMPTKDRRRTQRPEEGRPPKPSIDGGTLHVRGANQFVLERTTEKGLPFITGCNGKTSWAVRPDGPVRVSSDLSRFNRDLPGHEHSMPLNNLHDGLEQLKRSYDVQLLSSVDARPQDSQEDSRSTLLAIKKPKNRGPSRVEITYESKSGSILQMRFSEMPYGPELLNVQLTVTGEQQLGTLFFDHESHHSPNATVENEE